MLSFNNVSTFYGKIQALHNVSIEVEKGEIVTLIGANGAGKSTLLMTLCGSPRAASGSIRYMGEELVGQESYDIMRKSIAVVRTWPWAASSATRRTIRSSWTRSCTCSRA